MIPYQKLANDLSRTKLKGQINTFLEQISHGNILCIKSSFVTKKIAKLAHFIILIDWFRGKLNMVAYSNGFPVTF